MKSKSQNKKKNLPNKILITFLTVVLIAIGFYLHNDYGISIDEESTRFHGIVSLNYICEIFFPNQKFQFQVDNLIPKLHEYGYKAYGVFFEILLISIIEIFFEVKNFSEIFYARHFANHLLFIISIICFYFLCFNIFKNKLYSFFGSAILYTSPRIFAESFYNDKDLAFLSFFIFLIFFSIKFLKKPNYYNAFLLSFFAAMAISLRIVAIYVGVLILLFFLFDFLMKNKFDQRKIKMLLFFFILKFIFLYLFWPFLWENPIDNFIYALKSFSQYRIWDHYVFYLGNFHKSFYLPWHYLFVSFFSTTPLLISIFIAFGLAEVSLRFFKRLIGIDDRNSNKDIWRSEKEKILLFVFFLIFCPIFSIFLLDSVIYSGWRHLFFLYPPLILLLIYFFDTCATKFRKRKITVYINSILVIIFLSNIYNLITLHPFQYIYFNSFFEKNANKLFEIDYWGLSNKDALKNIVINNYKGEKITIGVASFTNLFLSEKMLPEKHRNKLIITGQDFSNVDFIFNNNYFEINPSFNDKYEIPKNYIKYQQNKKGNILINEFYIKK
jgi:hypothetical protein|tara:strand:+ start:168 stop:1826 length:1659 start_codon:yes stop_codon:yes gene_type:complete